MNNLMKISIKLWKYMPLVLITDIIDEFLIHNSITDRKLMFDMISLLHYAFNCMENDKPNKLTIRNKLFIPYSEFILSTGRHDLPNRSREALARHSNRGGASVITNRHPLVVRK